jgi:hypothetical protein
MVALVPGFGDTPSNGTPELPYKVEWVRVADRLIDSNYQRNLNQGLVNRISRDYKPHLDHPVVVSRRPNRIEAWVDGQHRGEAVAKFGQEYHLALVFEGLTQQEEAELHLEMNTQRLAPTTYDAWWSARFAGIDWALAIERAALANELELVKKSQGGHDRIPAIGACHAVFEHGAKDEDVLSGELLITSTLSVLRNAWYGQDLAFQGELIRGVGWFIAEDNPDIDRLIDRLSSFSSPADVKNKSVVAAAKAGQGKGGTSTKYTESVIRKIYRKHPLSAKTRAD